MVKYIITAVIPTRSRPLDLTKAVSSVIAQIRRPDEIVVVDQSPTNESRIVVERLMVGIPEIRLIYIHDQKVSGLVDAKRISVKHANGHLVCFLEDDVVLEHDYLAQIERGFEDRPAMIGCCGVVTNVPSRPAGYEFFFHLFHRGIFADKRVGVHGSQSDCSSELIASDKLSGGISAWRQEVFSVVPFDVVNGFHMLEDIDFSTRVAAYYASQSVLFINPRARLEHHCSPVNRDFLGVRQRRKLIEYIVYYKKRRGWPGSTIALPWLLVGLFLEAVHQSLSARSISVLGGFFSGLIEGFNKKLKFPRS